MIFKQRYEPMRAPETRIKNLKHLEYITTRLGVMCNPGCGFGCFGKISDMTAMANIDDLRIAKLEVGNASKGHTIYRAILSADRETAQKYGLYERDAWEKLLRSKISVIREAMHIRQSDFRWVASVHYKKNNPHVHIMYWDAGSDPRREFINGSRFEELSEHVRTVFTQSVENQMEINELHKESDAAVKAARLQLSAMFLEANVADILSIERLKPEQLSPLGKELMDLALNLPQHGRLQYDFVPAEYKAQLDTYLDHVMKLSDFHKLWREYDKLSVEVSQLYGNSPERIEEQREKSRRAFVKELGNETLKYLKGVSQELREKDPPKSVPELQAAIRTTTAHLIRDNDQYIDLLKMLPKHRTPFSELVKDERFRGLLDGLTREIANDLRIRSKMKGLLARDPPDKACREELSREIFRAVRSEIREALENDSGYRDQANSEVAVSGLLSAFSGLSMHKNQMHSQSQLRRERYRNLSETAKRDLRKQKEQEGSWELEP